ncbi:MAG: sensor histidine kinase [Sphingobacteriaceae bacterium]|nr:MAG: sensor histidine kinase [Sphingobacteriaceae bacterium]
MSAYKSNYLIVILLMILGYAQPALSQEPVIFRHLTVENGLSSSSVLSFIQDKSGFIWIGTMDGLNRFDGRTMMIFKSFYKNNIIEQNIQINKLMTDNRQNIWIGTNNGLYVYDIRRDSYKVFFQTGLQYPASLTNNIIKALWQDGRGNIWVGTEKGLNKLTADSNGQYHFKAVPLNLRQACVQTIFEDNGNNILIGTTNGLFAVSDTESGQLINKAWLNKFEGKNVTTLAKDRQHQLWVGTSKNGVYKFNKTLAKWYHYIHTPGHNYGLTSNKITKIAADHKGRVWVGTLNGLNLYNAETDGFRTFQHNSADKTSISNNGIFDVYVDKQGSVWIATFFGGVNVIEALTTNFLVYQTSDSKNTISSNIISSVVEGTDHNLWIGTEDEGLNFFNRSEGKFYHYKNNESLRESLGSNNVKALLRDKTGRIWVGLYNGGLDLLENKRFRHFKQDDRTNAINSNDVTCLLEDDSARIWIGHQARGLNIYDEKTQKMLPFETVYPGRKLYNSYITCLFQDAKKNIWIGTKQGLHRFNYTSRSISYLLKKDFPNQLNSDIINCITEGKDKKLWIGTYSGLSSYDPVKNRFKTYTVSHGLSGNMVVGILSDEANNLWVSTNNGLCKFDIRTERFSMYNIHDGLPANVFNYNSFYKDSKSRLFFGSHNGLVEFNPKQIETNFTAPEVKLTGLYLAGKAVATGDKSGVLANNITETKDITLNYKQNVVSIAYAVLNLIKPEKSMSAYKLEGYNKTWVFSSSHIASFTNLPAGKYTLLVKSCNNDGVWSSPEKLLQISVLPPFWLTWWAYLLYAIFFTAIVAGIFYFFHARAVLLRNLRYEQLSSAKQREVHQMKMDFFTHISHEIRTPLTMIMGPVEMLKSLIPPNSSNQKLVNSIKTNADRLLKLTNDLMDFRKADAGYTQLKIVQSDIVKFSKSVFDKFSENAKEQSIDFSFSSGQAAISLYFDPDHLEIVLTNLLSNALKFTPDGGKVSMQVVKRPEHVEIKVHDNGVGIPAEEQSKIFSNFYQIDAIGNKKPGSGIGLAFSKSLVELHQGEISFHSIVNTKGENETCFCILLKLGKDHFSYKTS